MIVLLTHGGKPELVNLDHVVSITPDPSDAQSALPRALLFFVEGRRPAGDICPVDQTLEEIRRMVCAPVPT